MFLPGHMNKVVREQEPYIRLHPADEEVRILKLNIPVGQVVIDKSSRHHYQLHRLRFYQYKFC